MERRPRFAVEGVRSMFSNQVCTSLLAPRQKVYTIPLVFYVIAVLAPYMMQMQAALYLMVGYARRRARLLVTGRRPEQPPAASVELLTP